MLPSGEFKVNNDDELVYRDTSVLMAEFSKLNSDDQDKKYKAYVELLDCDRRLLEDFRKRCDLADEGLCLDVLINDESSDVRLAVAEGDRNIQI